MTLRRILIAVFVVAILALATLFVLLQSLQRGDLRAGVEARLSAALGQPVSIGRIGVSLFPLSLSGTDVRVGEARVDAPALTIERVRIVPRIRSLFGGDVSVEELGLDGFVVAVLRDHDGAWHVPSVTPAPAAGGGGGPAIERVRISDGRVRVFDRSRSGDVREASSIDDVDAHVEVEAAGLRLAPITGRVGDAKISGEAGTDAKAVRLEFTAESIDDDDLPSFLRLLGSDRPDFLHLGDAASASVAIRVDRATSRLSGKGTLRAPRVRLEPVQLERFEAPFVIDGSRLTFQPTTFAFYGGTHEGSVSVRLSENPPAWATDSRVRGFDAGEFLNALAGADQRLDGKASVAAPLRGRIGESLQRSVNGRLQVTVTDGIIRNFPLLASINRAMRLTEQEAGDTRFEQLSATFVIAAGRGTTDDLVLQAGHLRVEAAGWIDANRALSLRGVAIFSPERSARAIASIRELSGLRNREGEIELPLTITGTLDAPSFGIDVESALRKGVVDELKRRIRRIIRR